MDLLGTSLMATGHLNSIKKANAILACLPPKQRLNRPRIMTGPETDCLRTGTVVNAQFGRDNTDKPELQTNEALGENPGNELLEDFVGNLLRRDENVVLVSHMGTIRRIMALLATLSGNELPEPLHDLLPDEAVAANPYLDSIANRLRYARVGTGVIL
jgi:hypothetical protein